MRKTFIILFLFHLLINLKAQDNQENRIEIDTAAKIFCDPKLEGMGPSKGVVVSYQRLFNQKVTTTSRVPEIGSASGKILRNNQLEVKVKIPFYNKPALKLLLGLNYEYQEFVFDSKNVDPQFELYNNLQQRHLKTIGASINGLKSFDEFHYMLFQVKGDLNGDYSADDLPTIDFLKGSVTAIYGIKKCVTKTYGFGLTYGYTFGRQNLIPVFLYNYTWNKRWGAELLLPAEARIRYNFNRSTLLYAGAEVDGASYNLKFENPPLSNIRNAQLRRSNIKGVVEFDREIHDWLWFGVSGGVMQPVSFKITEEGEKGSHLSFKDGIHWVKSDPLIDNEVGIAPFINVALFVVPPRKLENKLLAPRNNN
jgi:hypothetical protein